ncbi:MAG: hypothetical protein ACREH6_13760 [Geminicoccaceae bacterium]
MVLHDEDSDELRILEQALVGELAPDGVLQSLLAQQLAHAAWRLRRANRIEADLFAKNAYVDRHGFLASAATILARDCRGTHAFDTLLRYRGTTLAEFWRTLRTLKALQAEEAEARVVDEPVPEPASVPVLEFKRARAAMPDHPAGPSLDPAAPSEPDVREKPNEPERRGNPGDSRPATPAFEPDRPAIGAPPAARRDLRRLERRGRPQEPDAASDPNEPEGRGDPCASRSGAAARISPGRGRTRTGASAPISACPIGARAGMSRAPRPSGPRCGNRHPLREGDAAPTRTCRSAACPCNPGAGIA